MKNRVPVVLDGLCIMVGVLYVVYGVHTVIHYANEFKNDLN